MRYSIQRAQKADLSSLYSCEGDRPKSFAVEEDLISFDDDRSSSEERMAVDEPNVSVEEDGGPQEGTETKETTELDLLME